MNDDSVLYDNYFATPCSARKSASDIGKRAPAYIRSPKWEECFAIAFLQQLSECNKYNEYKDIELHDKQTGNKNSMDLHCKSANIGVEVTQAISDKFREEESIWNKPLCTGKSHTVNHKWKNQPTSFAHIKNAICKKIPKYGEYIKKYHPSDIDLFVYAVDARLIETDQKFLKGIPMPFNMGYPVHEDFGFGLQELLSEMNIPYRRIFIILGNYWYRYENKRIENCVMTEKTLGKLSKETLKIQESENNQS